MEDNHKIFKQMNLFTYRWKKTTRVRYDIDELQ